MIHQANLFQINKIIELFNLHHVTLLIRYEYQRKIFKFPNEPNWKMRYNECCHAC